MKKISKKLKRISNKLLKVIMLICVIFSSLQTPIYVFANEQGGTNLDSTTPKKGDMRLGKDGEITKAGTVTVQAGAQNLDTPGNVQVTKTVSAVNAKEGKYRVDFLIKGKDVPTVITTTKPIYFVIVFDKSGSMICDSSNDSYSYATYDEAYRNGDRIDNNRGNGGGPGGPNGGPNGPNNNQEHVEPKSYEAADGTTIWCSNASRNENYILEDKWESAVSGAVNFTTQLATMANTYVSVVTFASNASDATDFKHGAYEAQDFGHPVGNTNLSDALDEAQDKLEEIENKNAQKYILVISDGEPNSVSDAEDSANDAKEEGTKIYTIGYGISSGSDAEEVLKYISSNTTITPSENRGEDDIETYTDNGYYQTTGTSGITSALTTVFESVGEPAKAGTGAVLTDGIGKQFKIVTEDNTEVSSYGVNYVSEEIPQITEDGITLTFYIQINQDAPTGWYDTNANFTLKYKDANNNEQTINCDQNPQVYWVQNQYDYTVNYYKDSITEANLLASETRQAPVGTEINEFNVDKNKYLSEAGSSYEFERVNPEKIIITNDGTKQTINVLYVKIYGNLTVKHVDTAGTNLLTPVTTTKEIGTAYETSKEDIYGYTLTRVEGEETGTYTKEDITVTYVYTKNQGTPENIKENDVLKTQTNSIIGANSTFKYVLSYNGKVTDYIGTATVTLEDTLPYAVKNITYPEGCSYNETTRLLTCTKTVELDKNNQNINATFNIEVTYQNLTGITNLNVLNKVTSTLTFGSTEINDEGQVTDTVLSGKVTAVYVDEEGTTLAESVTTTGLIDTAYETSKKTIYGYTFKEVEGKETGTYTKEDITVTYVYTKNEGTTETNKVTKVGPKDITSVNGVFNYTLTYNGKITDYVGKATLTLKDTLPYEIDEELSTYEGCTYNNKILTCTKEYNIDEKNQDITAEYNLLLVFKNVDSEIVTNKVESTLDYGKTPDKDTDETKTEVFKGTVVAIYKNEQGETLNENITQEGLAGDNYETTELEFLGYTLTKTPENEKGKYLANSTIYVNYIYAKNVGTSEENLEKQGPQKVTDINAPFEYKITYNLEIFDYVGDVKITLTDHLPYEIDEEKSIIGDVCKYVDGKLVCEYLENITNKDNSKISIEENLVLYYKNITSNQVTNRVEALIVYGENEKIDEDEFTTEIPYGTLKVSYVTEDGKTLSPTEITTNLVGTEYKTDQKSFNNYHLKEIIGEKTGIYTEEETEVVYVYSLVPLPPQTGVESNFINYINLLIFATLVLVIKKRYL